MATPETRGEPDVPLPPDAGDAGPITPENARTLGSFGTYRKVAQTLISEFTVPPGTAFDTPEGQKAEDEECRIAFDSQGGVYPIRESVFRETYERASAEGSFSEFEETAEASG